MTIPFTRGAQLARVLESCSAVFESSDRFAIPDRVIASAINKFRGNNTIEAVLPKTILINSFYSTQIYDTETAANHILRTDADVRLESGDLTLIDSIRRGHGIVSSKTGKERDFYSFATKYTALHQPSKFPIFDNLVLRLLTALNKDLNFIPHFTLTDLRDYQYYVSVINALLDFVRLESFKYKRLDQGLWIYAKYLYDRRNLTKREIQNIALICVGIISTKG